MVFHLMLGILSCFFTHICVLNNNKMENSPMIQVHNHMLSLCQHICLDHVERKVPKYEWNNTCILYINCLSLHYAKTFIELPYFNRSFSILLGLPSIEDGTCCTESFSKIKYFREYFCIVSWYATNIIYIRVQNEGQNISMFSPWSYTCFSTDCVKQNMIDLKELKKWSFHQVYGWWKPLCWLISQFVYSFKSLYVLRQSADKFQRGVAPFSPISHFF